MATQSKPKTLRTAPPVGAPSTQIYGGQITNEDPNTDLTPRKARGGLSDIGAWERMVLSDAEAAGIAKMWTTPLVSAVWDVEPASDSDLDQQVAEFVRWNLFTRMRGTFKAWLRDATEYTWRGFYLGEQVWTSEMVKGQQRIVLDRISPRPTRYVEGWNVDDTTGDLASVSYTRIDGSGSDVVEIPADRLVRLAMNQHGNQFEGRSILRPCHPLWRVRRRVLKYMGIMIEKHAIPTPTATIDDTVPEAEIDRVQDMLLEFRSHERAYNILKKGIEIDYSTPGTETARYAAEVYQSLGDEMVRAALTMNLRTGSEGKGSYSLYSGQEGLIRRVLAGEADYIAETLTSGTAAPIARMVAWNFGDVAVPELRATNIAVVDPADLLQALTTATASGLLVPDESVRNKVRELFNLPPEVAEATPSTTPTQTEPPAEQPPGTMALDDPPVRLARSGRPLSEVELCLDLDAMMGGKEAKAADGLAAVEAATREALKPWVKKAQPLIAKGDAAGVLALPLPEIDTTELERVFARAAQQGRSDIRDETKRRKGDKIVGPSNFADGVLEAASVSVDKTAETAALKTARTVQSAAVNAAATIAEDVALGSTAPDAAAITDAAVLAARGPAKGAVRDGVNRLYAVGRLEEGDALSGDKPAEVVFTNSPSSVVCDTCEALNGEHFTQGTADFADHHPPFSGCESTASGSNRCNCAYIWLL